jgi:hypothetical protein
MERVLLHVIANCRYIERVIAGRDAWKAEVSGGVGRGAVRGSRQLNLSVGKRFTAAGVDN